MARLGRCLLQETPPEELRAKAEIADLIYVISNGRVIESGAPQALRDTGGEWTRQFMGGLPDGPVPFHYPAEDLEMDLFEGYA